MTDSSLLPLKAGGAPSPACVICGELFRYSSKPECFPKYFCVWVIFLGVQKIMKQTSVRGTQKDKDRGIPRAQKITKLFISPDIRRNCMDGGFEDTKNKKETFPYSKFAISRGPVHWRHRQSRLCTTDIAQDLFVVSPKRNQETGPTFV